MRSIFLMITGLFLFLFTFLYMEPFVTKEKVKKELQGLTGEVVTKQEWVGKNNNHTVTSLQTTQTHKTYRITYASWDAKKTLQGEKQSLILSVEEKIGDQFKPIYTKQ